MILCVGSEWYVSSTSLHVFSPPDSIAFASRIANASSDASFANTKSSLPASSLAAKASTARTSSSPRTFLMIAGAESATASGPLSFGTGADFAHSSTLVPLGGTTNTPYLACIGSLYTFHPSGLASDSSNATPSL